MTRQHHQPILLTLFVALALCAGMLGACGQQQQASTDEPASSEATETGTETAEATGEDAQASTDSAPDEAAAQEASTASTTDPSQAFASWNADSASLAKLIDYVQGVTDQASPNYVEPEERVATFDMDGTLLCEKAPVYVDYCVLMHRVLEDPTYEAPAEDKALLERIRANADEGILDSSLDEAKGQALVTAFADMTPEDFRAYVNEFIDTTEAEGFEGMTYGESVYQPMREVVEYLKANDFEVYVVSACEREVARAISTSKLGVAPDHVIGTDCGTKATGQGDESALDYTFEQDDQIVFDGTMSPEVGKLNKVIYIEREIGIRPLLSFGNSSGDYAMLNYALSNPDHEGMGFLVICDDVEREYGDLERAEKQTGEAEEAGWTTFSMADDWATIYGDGVVKTELRADAEQELAEAA